MNRHIYTLKKPASWHQEMWREALPLGNGLSAISIPGCIGKERILFNRHDLWEDGFDSPVPNVVDVFQAMRDSIDKGDYNAVNQNNLATALCQRGYGVHLDCVEPLGWMNVDFEPEADFKKYRRGVNMRTGEAFVEFQINGCQYRRQAFVSRDSDVTVFRMTADKPFTTRFGFELYKKAEITEITETGIKCVAKDGYAGVKLLFVGDYTSKVKGASVEVTGKDYMVLIRCSSLGSDLSLDHVSGQSYGELLEKHTALHTPLYDALNIEFSDDEDQLATNEQMLAEAYDDQASPALLERIWRFGRYLFISAAAEDSLPVPLYGRWHGKDHLIWTQFVANENVEMTYWHAMSGGLSYALPSLIHYYTKHMDKYRENAKQIFGVDGIWVCAYTTPHCFGVGERNQVIANWISAAGWLSRHFWEYYVYTKDEKLLREEILPFMYEAAVFYREYAVDDGKYIRIYPSVSPENAPLKIFKQNGEGVQENVISDMDSTLGPVYQNATMDFAIMKELLTNLLDAIEITGMYAEEADSFRTLLAKIPPYAINEDGAIKEWTDPHLIDNYYHRHLSHVYPVFPGNEITAQSNPELFEAFKKAVSLRKLGAQTGWSLAHMASIYARMGDGDRAVACIDTMEKSCTMDSLFTVHNDWRNMGTSLYMGGSAPMNLDAVWGAVNAIQEMLFCWQKDSLSILPALPKRLSKGCARGFVFPEGMVDIEWTESGSVTVVIHALREVNTKILLGGKERCDISLAAGKSQELYFEL